MSNKYFLLDFNNQRDILNILLTGYPKVFIQKVLNYSSTDFKLINHNIIEVTFYREINSNFIEMVGFNDRKLLFLLK